jgi:transposase-like protein
MAKSKPKKKPPKRRRYTDNDRASALAALAANAGNLTHTARQLGIPKRTLSQWAAGSRHPEATQAAEGKKGELADGLEEVAWKLANVIPEKLAGASLKDTAVALGIVIDKMRLLREQPTAISKTESGNDDLAKRIDDYASAFARATDREEAGGVSGDGSRQPVDTA